MLLPCPPVHRVDWFETYVPPVARRPHGSKYRSGRWISTATAAPDCNWPAGSTSATATAAAKISGSNADRGSTRPGRSTRLPSMPVRPSATLGDVERETVAEVDVMRACSGPGLEGPRAMKPRICGPSRPRDPAAGHGNRGRTMNRLPCCMWLYVGGHRRPNGRAELLTASYEGIHVRTTRADSRTRGVRRTHTIAPGGAATSDKPGRRGFTAKWCP